MVNSVDVAGYGDIKTVNVFVSGDTEVIVDKLIGPAGGCNVRVTVDTKSPEFQWVIERSRALDAYGIESEWVEVARFPLQADDDPLYMDLEE